MKSKSSSTIDITAVRPLRDLVLVQRYERPEKIGSIWLPDEARHDSTMSLWEPIAFGPKAKENFWFEYDESAEGVILQTRPWRGTFIDDNHALICAHEFINAIFW